jgi:hypothetical protein
MAPAESGGRAAGAGGRGVAAGARVPVRALRQALRLGPADLVALVEQAVGRPVVNRAREREGDAALRQDVWQYAAARLADYPVLVARMRGAGIRDENGAAVRRLIDALAAAAERLPADPPVSLPKLAHDTAGDPHFFDLDTLAGARLVTLASELAGQAEPTRPDRIRALLEQTGVVADRLTATVLPHHVAALGDGPVDQRLRDAVAPVALPLLDLTRTPPRLDPVQVLTPSVLEAALALGRTAPLACTSGQLRAVDHALLHLAAARAWHCGTRATWTGPASASPTPWNGCTVLSSSRWTWPPSTTLQPARPWYRWARSPPKAWTRSSPTGYATREGWCSRNTTPSWTGSFRQAPAD